MRRYRGPVGLTWNGGIAVTAGDYENSKKAYQEYLSNPDGYERTREKLDPSANPPKP